MEELPKILTAQDIAKYLRVSRGSVYELMKLNPSSGGIPSFDIGLSKRVERKDFLDWVESRKREKAGRWVS